MDWNDVEADLKKDWPRLVAFVQAFSLVGWTVLLLAVLFLYVMAQSWYVFVIFGFGVYLGYTQRTHIEQMVRTTKAPKESRETPRPTPE